MPELRIGILGCGRIIRLAHLRSLQEHAGVRVVAMADPDPGARAYCAEHAPSAIYYTDHRELLSRAALDAVVIALPTLLHRDAATLAFERGLHVYLEKPVASTIADAEAILASGRRAGTVGAIGFNCRFNRLYRELKRAISAGEIGTPIAVRAAMTANWPTAATWRLSPDAGGGALLELASHQVDLCRFLLSTEISSATATTWSNRGVDEAAMLQLTLANGVHVQLLVSYGTAEEDRWDVYGDKGKLVVDRYNSNLVEHVPLRASGGIASAVRRAVSELTRVPYGLEKRRAPGQEPSYRASLHAFVETVRTRRQGSPSLEDGLAALRVIDVARSSGAAHA